MKKILAFAAGLLLSQAVGAATPITAGTDLSTVLNASGEYELQTGIHTANTFTIAADVTLTSVEGATLVIPDNVILEYRDNFEMTGVQVRMATGSQLKAEAESGDTFVSAALIADNTFMATGVISTPPRIYIGQGFNSYHRNIVVRDNNIYSVILLEEVGDNNDFIDNYFFNMAGLRPIQYWGSNHTISGNYVNGGIFGITALGKHNIAAGRRPCTGNVIRGNIVLNTSEEGISFDVVGNVAAETVIREYDTVSAKPGSPVFTLASANWGALTTYTGSVYDMVFVSGALAGKRYKITTHSGANFTTDIGASEYALSATSDGVSIQLSCYANTIANNIVIPLLNAERAHTTGITLHGTGVDMNIVNNIVYGENDGVGAGDTSLTYYGIREASLNSIVGTDSVTGVQRRAPVGLNRIIGNRSLGGGVGADYKNYGALPDFTPPASTYSDNSVVTRSWFDWVGGEVPSTKEGYRPKDTSPLCRAGTPVLAGVTKAGRRVTARPDIGALACRPTVSLSN